MTKTEEKADASDDEAADEMACYNHPQTPPQRYCNDHNQPVCLECAFELHRSCRDVEVLDAAASGRRAELEQLCEALAVLGAQWESVLLQLGKVRTALDEDKSKTRAAIEVGSVGVEWGEGVTGVCVCVCVCVRARERE